MQNYSHEHLTHFLLFLVLKCSLVKTIVNCGYHRYLLTKLFVGSALVSVMYGFLSNLHLRATVWSYSNWIGQDQRSDHCGARTHDYCLSAGKQQPPTAQATPTGTPAPLHTHSKTLVKPLELVTTKNNIAKQELFWKWPNINKHQGVVIWAKKTFLTAFKSSSNTLPKREEILST